jgi:glutathione peroxidase
MRLYDFSVVDANNNNILLLKYKGKILLIVNGATECGFTKQYDGLQILYEKYKPEGFEILDFPSNQFLNQAPGTIDEIVGFCKLNFGVEFKQFAKIDVNGENEEPLYKFLKSSVKETRNDKTEAFYEKVKGYTPGIDGNDIRWNFTKFLVDREGNVIFRFATNITPEEIESYIVKLLQDDEGEIVCSADFSAGCTDN